MLCIGQKHELDFSRGDYDEIDKIGAHYLGHGVWMYTRNTSEDDLGKESEEAEYCFCALGCHRIGIFTNEQRTSLTALGIAVNLQKTIGGYVYWCEEPEGFTFYLGGVGAFKDRTYDWWAWPFPDDWWVSHLNDDFEVADWKALAAECMTRERDWYMSMIRPGKENDNA